jgi:hypothetical protein
MHLQGVKIDDQTGDTLLYAGEIRVKITDWFIFKKEAELKYISLSNAIVKLQRLDSTWRHQFLLDYFTPASSGTRKNAGIEFNLKKIVLQNVKFIKKDAWLGDDLSAYIGKLELDAKKINLSENKFEINSLLLKDPVVTLNSYTGLKPVITSLVSNEDDADTASSYSNGPLVQISRLKIINGTFGTDKQTDRKPFPYFDGQHLLFTNINGEINNSLITGDTVFTSLTLSAKERSGFEVKSMKADLKMTPTEMAFSDLKIVTNHSTIRNYFRMSYNNMGEFGNFIHNIRMDATFDDSNIDSDDIAFFAPALSAWKKTIKLKGLFRGTVDDLVGRDMIIQAGKNTVLNGDITLTGLPEINQTFIDFTSNNFKTTYSDASTFIPAIKRVSTPDLKKIQYLNFKGSFTGFIRDFVTFGTINTNLGNVKSDLNMKLPVGQAPAYSGNISTDNFAIGQFLGDENLGAISMKGTLKGRGFNEKDRNTLLDGVVNYVDYNNYRYSNIQLNGKLNKKFFEGLASIHDQNVDFNLKGIIDFNSETPRFDLLANVSKANLRSLKLTKDSIELKGIFNFNFTSSSIDNFLGTAKITNAEISKEGHRIPFDSLIVSSEINDNIYNLKIKSNEFSGYLAGNFTLSDLPNGITYLLNRYYPSYIKPPKNYPKDQSFAFDIKTQYVDEYLQLIDSSISGMNFSHIYGNVDLRENKLNLTAEVPQFKYRKYNFDNVQIVAAGNSSNLTVTGETYNIQINDSLNIPKAAFKITASHDSSRVSIVSGANRNVDTANLNALILTYDDGVKIEFDPSTFTINRKLWAIDENGELEFRSSIPASGQLILKSGEQVITMKTSPAKGGGNWNDLNVNLEKVNVGDFSPIFLPKNRLEGLVSGKIIVEDPTNKFKVTTNDLATKFLRFDNDSLGEVKASLVYDNPSKKLVVKGNTINENNYLGFDAELYFNEKAKDNVIDLKANKFYLKILERFLGNLFSDIRGYLTGDIHISGEFDNISVTGKGNIVDAGLKVGFTQCFYKIKDTNIELTPELINLDGIVLTDTVTKNPIYIRGGIEHQSFKNMFYNLDISTRKPNTTNENNNRPVLLINTTYKDNKQFYGYAVGTGSMSLLGPQNNMFMKIDAIASDKDSSYVTIPPSTSRESGLADFLVERKFGKEMTALKVRNDETNIIYDVDVTANPYLNVKVVLDELTGDEIKGKGSGTLNIRSGTTEPLTLRGKFDIQEGSYLFTFQSFFKKPFELRKDAGNYIEWNGDPYNANIKFEAAYRAERVSYAPLGNSLNLNSAVTNARGDVYVIANLTGNLFKPDIEFSLDFPNSSIAVTDPELALVIQQMQKNVNELNRQVTYLIVFNSFAPSELGQTNTGTGIGINTISGIFLNVISDQINKILGNLLKNEKYRINLNTALYNRNIIDQNNTRLNLGSNVNFSIGRSFFNNRFIISTGVGFDAALQQTDIQQSVQFLPDVTLEWLINPSGSIRTSFFYRENTDYLGATNNVAGISRRIGGSISYKKEFDRLSDIFKKKKPKIIQEQEAGLKNEEEKNE